MALSPYSDSTDAAQPDDLDQSSIYSTQQKKAVSDPTQSPAPTPVQPTTSTPLPISGMLGGTTVGSAPAGTSDPLAFMTSLNGMLGTQQSAAAPAPTTTDAGSTQQALSGLLGSTQSGGTLSTLNPTNPATFPTTPTAATPAPAPAATSGYGGTGTYGNLDYADAVQAAYRAQQAQEAATGIDATPIDYSQQGLADAGLWGQSAADQAANAARAQSIINDPNSTAAAKQLAALPGYGTPAFDQSLNNGSNPDLANQVQQLLGQSAAQHVATPAQTGEDYLVGGQHYTNLADAQKAEAALAAGGSSGASGLTPGAANDAGSPSSGIGGLLAQLSGSSAGAGGTTGATGSGVVGQALANAGKGVSLSPTDPNNPLTSQTITPDNSVDRVKLAQDSLNSTIQNILDPQFQADQQSLNRYNFGAGRGVSGMARTSQGDLTANYERTKANLANQLLTAATTGSIQDMYNNLGIAQQQQQFQSGQQQTAFNQALQSAELQDALTNSAFGRSQAQEQAGYANNPSDIDLLLSQIFGGQSSAAGNAAAGLFNAAGQGSQSSATNTAMTQYLLQLLGLGGGSTATSGAGNANPPIDDGQ